MNRNPFTNEIARQMETPLSRNGGKDPTMSEDPMKKMRRVNGHCPHCGKNTDWREVRNFVAPKNAPVVSQLETQVAWECAECGGRRFL